MKIYKEKNFWAAAFLVFLLDQATKIWALHLLPFEKEINLTPYLSFLITYNEGMMASVELPFGLTVQQFRLFWLLIAIAIGVSIWWVTRQPALNQNGWTEEFSKTGLFLFLGAAWGNAFDRIFREKGAVDFLQINYFIDTIPIINFADAMVYLGLLAVSIGWVILLGNLIIKKISFLL